MKILHVVPLVSASGSYGGPVSVALDQAGALADLGHNVTIAAGWDGVATVRSRASVELFPAKKLLRRSFAGLVSPPLLAWLWRNVGDFDVVHVHLTRDALTLPAAAIAQQRGIRVVLQTHGQIRPRRSRLQALFDVALTRRVFAHAASFLALTTQEVADLRSLGVAQHRIRRIVNAAPTLTEKSRFVENQPLVIFSSRLAARKRPVAFVETASLVSRERPDVRFEIWGPDDGELTAILARIKELGLDERCSYLGAVGVEESRRNLAGSQVFVLPSVAEPFPMALLEAFAAGVPSVITSQTGLSKAAHDAGASRVTDGSPAEMAQAVLDLLASQPDWEDAAAAGLRLARDDFSLGRVAERLSSVYATTDDR